jgi:Hypothetical protein (DUF2513)
MQVHEYRNREMRRDVDLVRDLLLQIEEDPRFDGTKWVHPATPDDIGITGHTFEEVAYHLTMMVEEGFVTGNIGMELIPSINKLTWKGHEFLDDIRDPYIWKKSKERAKVLMSVSIAFAWELAKAEIKRKLGLP